MVLDRVGTWLSLVDRAHAVDGLAIGAPLTPVALAILALLATSDAPRTYASHLGPHPEARAAQLGAYVESAARSARLDVASYLALLYHESGLSLRARSRVGAIGVGQLYWRGYVRSWRADCRLAPSRCEESQFTHAAWALRSSLRQCRTYLRAYHSYRSGACGVNSKALATARLARMIRERLERPSLNRLRAPVLR